MFSNAGCGSGVARLMGATAAPLQRCRAAARHTALLRSNDASLRVSDASLRLSDASLRVSDASLRLSDASLRLSDASLRLSDASLRLSDARHARNIGMYGLSRAYYMVS